MGFSGNYIFTFCIIEYIRLFIFKILLNPLFMNVRNSSLFPGKIFRNFILHDIRISNYIFFENSKFLSVKMYYY